MSICLKKRITLSIAWLVGISVLTSVGLAQETEESATPMPEPAVKPAPREIEIVSPAPQSPAPVHAPAPYTNLRRLPKKLRPVEGQAPPPGYVEVERRKKALIIGGGALFGATYLASILLSTESRPLLIPVVGPIIAGWQYEPDMDNYFGTRSAEDRRYSARLLGVFGTLAQSAGIAMFVWGMASKKTLWLRQDIAGVRIQITPTVVGRKDPGLGIAGTF